MAYFDETDELFDPLESELDDIESNASECENMASSAVSYAEDITNDINSMRGVINEARVEYDRIVKQVHDLQAKQAEMVKAMSIAMQGLAYHTNLDYVYKGADAIRPYLEAPSEKPAAE